MKQIKTRKVLKYFDPIFKKNFSLKVEKVLSKNQEELKITLPKIPTKQSHYNPSTPRKNKAIL